MLISEVLLLILGAYLLGSIPSAYLAAKWARGIDIRQYGSGNSGVSNILTLGSKWWLIPVTVFDLGKGMLPVYLAQLIDLPLGQQVIIGLAAIAGHNWTIFLRFDGGRGILTTAGVIFILAPWLALVLTIITFAGLPFRQVALSTVIALTLSPIFSWFMSGPFGIEKSPFLTLGLVTILLLAVLRRLTAPRTTVTASVPSGELIINRLLFDRDIRDRKAWINRTPSPTPPDNRQEEKPTKG